MNAQPAGWYPDPYAAISGTERWWDGSQWLAETRQAAPAGFAQGVENAPQYVPQGQGSSVGALASWGRRLGAALLDGIPFVILMTVLLGQTSYVEDLVEAIERNDQAALAALDTSSLTVPSLVVFLLQAIYNVGFHATSGQTLGKRIVGIRVVRASDPALSPSIVSALLRWFVQMGLPNLLGNVPLIGLLASLFSFVNHLWPLWDQNKQALHDKAAKTVVVRVR